MVCVAAMPRAGVGAGGAGGATGRGGGMGARGGSFGSGLGGAGASRCLTTFTACGAGGTRSLIWGGGTVGIFGFSNSGFGGGGGL